MGASFYAYIDESGDDGFAFPRSSEWITMSAVVMPTATHLSTLHRTREILSRVGWCEGKSVHFGSTSHERRIFLITELSNLPVIAVSVMVHKPSLTQEAFRTKGTGRLYGYMVRLLLERLSWYCRDNRPAPDSGDGTIHLIFDNRTRGSHLKIRSYVNLLREAVQTTIHWPVIVNDQIDAHTPRDHVCLHLADFVAGAMREALESSEFGHTEHRFAKMLPRVTYRGKQGYNGFGLKFFPQPPDLTKHPWLVKYYGWK
jgi:hypothetical protein